MVVLYGIGILYGMSKCMHIIGDQALCMGDPVSASDYECQE